MSSRNKSHRNSQSKSNSTSSSSNSMESKSSAESTSSSNGVCTPPPNTDIETYYRARGLSYSHARRLNRNYVNYDGPCGDASRGIVFWDSFSPPPGYSVDDLPNSESMVLSQPKEAAVSPAILAAGKNKLKPRPILGEATSSDDFNDLINKLKFKAKRKTPDKENSPQNVKKSSPAVKILRTPLEAEEGKELPNNTFNSSEEFPEFDDDDLNDSALIRCTQAAEKEFEEQKNKEKDNPFRILDLVDPLSAKRFHIGQKTTPLKGHLKGPMSSSTPLNCGPSTTGGDTITTVDVTPRSARRSKRSSSRITNSTVSTAVASASSSASANIFESSIVEPDSAKSTTSLRRSQRTTLSRMLFTPKEAEPPKNKVGDFESDDDDDLFSQIEIPYVENANGGSKEIRELCEQSTLLVSNDESDSFLNNASSLTQTFQEDLAVQNRNSRQKSAVKQKPRELEELQTQVVHPDIIIIKESPPSPKRTKSKPSINRLKGKPGHR